MQELAKQEAAQKEQEDKKMWDAAYREEFFGLKDLPCWVTISDEQYKALKPKVDKALPTMAISTMKFDAYCGSRQPRS